jgi:hypothetical protein
MSKEMTTYYRDDIEVRIRADAAKDVVEFLAKYPEGRNPAQIAVGAKVSKYHLSFLLESDPLIQKYIQAGYVLLMSIDRKGVSAGVGAREGHPGRGRAPFWFINQPAETQELIRQKTMDSAAGDDPIELPEGLVNAPFVDGFKSAFSLVRANMLRTNMSPKTIQQVLGQLHDAIGDVATDGQEMQIGLQQKTIELQTTQNDLVEARNALAVSTAVLQKHLGLEPEVVSRALPMPNRRRTEAA